MNKNFSVDIPILCLNTHDVIFIFFKECWLSKQDWMAGLIWIKNKNVAISFYFHIWFAAVFLSNIEYWG